MKRLLLAIPFLLSTMAIGPCGPIRIGNVDGGDRGTGGARPDAGIDRPPPDAGTDGDAGRVGGEMTGAGGATGGADAGGSGGSGGSAGTVVLHPSCAANGWVSETVLYTRGQLSPDFDYQMDVNGVLHVVMRTTVGGYNTAAYTRCLSGGGCEFPVSLAPAGAVAVPTIGVERSGLPHIAWTGVGNSDDIRYSRMDENGRWAFVEQRAVAGSFMAPVQVRAENGSPFIVYLVSGIGFRGIAAKRNGAWVNGPLPTTVTVVSSEVASDGTAHLLYADNSGLIHGVVQSNLTLTTEVVTPTTVTAVKLVIDTAGTLHALYSGAGRVAYASRGSAGWAEELLPEGSAALSLKVDSAGRAHVVMTAPGGGLSHALRSGGTWSVAPVAGPAAAARGIVEDNNGSLHQMRGENVGSNTVHYIHDQICIPSDLIDRAAPGSNQGAWRGRPTPTRPSLRSLGAMVYDSARKEIVHYGGTSAADFPLGRTPLPNPGTWTLASAGGGWVSKGGATHPGARIAPGMAFDAGRGRVVLMGGGSDGNVWEWDGSGWTARTSAAPAPALTGTVRLAYDSGRSRVVVWASDGIWDWNGAAGTFTARASAPPEYVGAPRGDHDALFVDAATGHAVGFGAGTWDWDPVTNVFSNLNVVLAQDSSAPFEPGAFFAQLGSGASFAAYDGQFVRTWRRGQTAWAPASTGFGPLRRWGTAMTFDPTRGALVLFGGTDQSAPTAGVQIYTDPDRPSWDIFSNNTEEWVPPSQ